MKSDDKRIQQYLRQLRRFLLVSSKRKKELARGVRDELADYLAAHPEADFQQIAAEYGNPRDTAQNLLESAGLAENIAIRKRKRMLLIAAALLIAVFIVFLVVKVIQMKRETTCEVVETIVVYDKGRSSHTFEDASSPEPN